MTDEFVAASDQLGQGFGDAAALADGSFVLVWDDGNGLNEVARSEIALRTLDAHGVPLGPEVTIDQPGSAQGAPHVDESDVGFVVSWWAHSSDEDASHIVARRFDADAEPSGTEFAVSPFTVDGYSALGVGADGSFMVAWENREHERPIVFAMQYGADDAPVASQVTVSVNTAVSATLPAVARLSGGGFVVVWASYPGGNNTDETSLFARTFTAAGEAERVFQIETRGGSSYPAVAGDPFGGFTVVCAGKELTAQRFTRNPHCADADGDGSTTASDALVVLHGALGTASCAPCVCDIDSSNATTASDALRVLHAAIGDQELSCPACVVTDPTHGSAASSAA